MKMPVWNIETKHYEAETGPDLQPGVAAAAEREERFRTALLNELDGISRALGNLEDDRRLRG